MKRSNKLGLLSATILTMGMGAALPAQAQDAPAPAVEEEEDVIVVTGSRIRRDDLTSSAPIQVITARTIDERGITNVADAINATPGLGVPINEIGDQATFATGRNFVNIFNLGSQRTLTLVNGRRFVSSNATQIVGGLAAQGTQVDLNSIPTALIDRIETIQAGGAAVYGSDAIAGVVNIILRDDFEGFELDAQAGISDQGDFPRERLRGTWGVNLWDRGNIALSAEWNRTGELLNTDRDRTRAQIAFANNPLNTGGADGIPGQIVILDRRVPEVTQGGLILASNSISLAQVRGRFDENGNIVTHDPGTFYQASIASGGDGFNLGEVTALATPLDRFLLSGLGHYDLTDNIRLNVEVMWNRVTASETANQPVYQSGLFGGTSGNLTPAMGMTINNPFLTPQAVAFLQTAGPGGTPLTNFHLARASTDLVGGANRVDSEADTSRVMAGFEGDFALGNHDFFWNVNATFGNSNGYFSQPSIVQSRFANAVNAVSSGGQIVCAINADAPTANDDPACAPLNLFGEGRASQAALDYITTDFRSDFENIQTAYEANFGGELIHLPGGDLSMVVGYEWRKEKGDFTPNEAQQLGLGRSVAIAPVTGSYSTSEYYVEGLLPIFGEDFTFPLMHRLELEGAYRKVDSSQSGENEAWTFAARYYPYEDLLLRGTMSQTFRAPAIAELFLPQVSAFSFATDPCHNTNFTSGPNPAVRTANCVQAFTDLGIANPQTYLTTFTSNVQAATIQIITGGNPTLVPEEAESWSAGLVFQPSQVPGLVISGDWVNIDLTNSIENFTLTSILQTCYDSPTYPVAACSNFARNAAGQVVSATTGRVNAGYRYFQGATISIEYEFDVAAISPNLPGTLSFDLDLFHVNRLETSVNGTGFDLNDDKGEIGNSDLEANLTTQYSNGPFRISWLTRYIGDAVFDKTFTPETRDPLGVDSYILNDASFIYDFTDNLTGRLVVNNIFDVEPPYPTATPFVYDIVGRYFYLGLSARF